MIFLGNFVIIVRVYGIIDAYKVHIINLLTLFLIKHSYHIIKTQVKNLWNSPEMWN